jgi:hypothetical protein
MAIQVFRPNPIMPAHAYKTYEWVAPLGTHFRKATCADAACPAYLNGWRVRVETLTPELLHTAKTAGRKFVEQRVTDSETWLVFEAGQPCFRASEHRVRVNDRPPLYIVRDGDHRGNPRGTKARLHQRPEHWLEDFAEHQQGLADEIAKG